MDQNKKEKDNNIVKNVGYYSVVISPKAEGIAAEPHYAVFNRDTEVVEFRSAGIAACVHYATNADKYYSVEIKGEKDVKLALANDVPLSLYANDPDFH